jgi:hypothetical protein
MPVRVEDAHSHAADSKDNGGQQHHSHQAHGELLLLGCEAWGNYVSHQPGGEKSSQNCAECEDDQYEVDDGAGQGPRLAAALLDEIAGEGGYEGGAQRSPGDQLEDQVRDTEGRQIGIEFAAGAELTADEDLPSQPQETAEDECGHDQGGRSRELGVASLIPHLSSL